MWDNAIDDASRDIGEIFSRHIPNDILRSQENIEFEADALGEDVDKIRIERVDGQETAILNLDALPEEDVERIYSYYFDMGGLFSPGIQEDISLVSAALSDDELQEIVEYFNDYLTDYDVKLISRCLAIRQDWESPEYTTKKRMTKRRDELSDEDNFGDEALVVSNLCSSGYYDEDGYIRDLFRKAEEQRTDENSVHQRLYNLILAEEPFTVFVSPSNNPHKIAEELVEKLEKSGYYMVEFDFVDAHAQGGSNRDILEKTVINLHISSERLKYIAEINERETVFRFDSESFVASE